MLCCEREPDVCPPAAPVDIMALRNSAGALQRKYGFHPIVFWTLIDARDMRIGSMAHIRYLHGVETNNTEVIISDNGEKCAVIGDDMKRIF